MGYIALKRFPVGDGHSVPGELCKEAENWKDPKKWINWGYIIPEKDFKPGVHLKGAKAPSAVTESGEETSPAPKQEAVAEVEAPKASTAKKAKISKKAKASKTSKARRTEE